MRFWIIFPNNLGGQQSIESPFVSLEMRILFAAVRKRLLSRNSSDGERVSSRGTQVDDRGLLAV